MHRRKGSSAFIISGHVTIAGEVWEISKRVLTEDDFCPQCKRLLPEPRHFNRLQRWNLAFWGCHAVLGHGQNDY